MLYVTTRVTDIDLLNADSWTKIFIVRVVAQRNIKIFMFRCAT